VPIAPSPDDQVARLALLTEAHLTHVNQQIGVEIAPEAGSMGAVEQENAEQGPAGPWGNVPPHTAMSLAKLKVTIASDHIGSLHKLLQPPLPLFGLMVIARSSVEASSKAFWLLDPNISVRERVARELGEGLDSAQEERRALQGLIPDWEDHGAVADIESEALNLGVVPVRIPSKTELVGAVLRHHMETPERGQGLYRYMSAMAHNTNYAALQHFKEVRPSGDNRSQIVQGHLSLEGVWSAVAGTLAAHTSALGSLLMYLGRDLWAWNRWERKIAMDMNEASRSFATGH
jgi:hypothetical protein